MNRNDVYSYLSDYDKELIDQALLQLGVKPDQQEGLGENIIEALEVTLGAMAKAEANPSKALVSAKAEGNQSVEGSAIATQVLECVDVTDSLVKAGCSNQQLFVMTLHNYNAGRKTAAHLHDAKVAGFVTENEQREIAFQGKLLEAMSLTDQSTSAVLNPNTINGLVQKQKASTQEVDWNAYIESTVAQAKQLSQPQEVQKVQVQTFDLEAELEAWGL